MTTENSWATLSSIHSDLVSTKELIYDTCGFECTQPAAEIESAEYGACMFSINGMSVRFRVAKITPTKTGQFVTIWKRSAGGPIEPFEISDDIDLVVISTRDDNHFGQFVFPKSVLLDKGIISGNNKEGKRGIRVYPPWDYATIMSFYSCSLASFINIIIISIRPIECNSILEISAIILSLWICFLFICKGELTRKSIEAQEESLLKVKEEDFKETASKILKKNIS